MSCGCLSVEVNHRTTGERPQGFTTAVKEKWILTSQTNTEYKSAGGKVQNIHWLSTWLISGPGLRHNCIFMHQLNCSFTSATIIHCGAPWKVILMKQLQNSTKETVSTCFLFVCTLRPFQFELTSSNCLIPALLWNQLGIYNFYISCLKTQLHSVRNANVVLCTKTFPMESKKKRKKKKKNAQFTDSKWVIEGQSSTGPGKITQPGLLVTPPQQTALHQQDI